MKRHAIIHTIICIIAVSLIVAAAANAYMAPGNPLQGPNPQGLEQETVVIEGYNAKICFPAESWNAYFEDRPCDLIEAPYEDGSSNLILGTIGSRAAECVIPNPYEERGDFVIHCHRVKNR